MPNVERMLEARKRAEGRLEIAEEEIEVLRVGLDTDLDPVVRADLLQSLAAYERLVEQYRARIGWLGSAIEGLAVPA